MESMPSITGYVDDEQKEAIDELVEEKRYEDRSEVVQAAISYFLYHRH